MRVSGPVNCEEVTHIFTDAQVICCVHVWRCPLHERHSMKEAVPVQRDWGALEAPVGQALVQARKIRKMIVRLELRNKRPKYGIC